MNYFYHPNPETDNQLSNEESFHCIKVLRKKRGDQIDIIDGKGHIFKCKIENDSHRNCSFSILEKIQVSNSKDYYIHIAIAPTKNQDRIEWFVEKTCELGVDEISFINTKRTERKKINLERIEKKAVSAMKQSKNLNKTKVNALISFEEFLQSHAESTQNFIAFVDHNNESQLFKTATSKGKYLVLIGPEGDFIPEEVSLAKHRNFQMVSLGNSVLRTETAGVIACHTLNLINSHNL